MSAVNIVDGGALTILKSFVDVMNDPIFHGWSFIVLVNPLVKVDFGRVKKISFVAPKKSWLIRLYYEYIVFKKISKVLRPDVWFSLHDLTPNVIAKRRYVYCHNPSPFYRPSLIEALLDPKFIVFNKLYKFFYKININKNTAVIVQQNWIKESFDLFVKVPVHVNHPKYIAKRSTILRKVDEDKVVFVYPSFPRVFKNHAIICNAIKLMKAEERARLKVIFTISGSENLYSRWIKFKAQSLPEIIFTGRLTYDQTQDLYQTADCLLFPSKLETWGLPLTEAKCFNKDIICSDLPYAKETLGGYQKSLFVPPENAKAWLKAISEYCKHRELPSRPGIEFVDVKQRDGIIELLKLTLND